MHESVLLKEVINRLQSNENAWLLDGTFGRGGHTRALLQANPNMRVIGIDRDPDAIQAAEDLTKEFESRFFFFQGTFSDFPQALAHYGISHVDRMLLDLGVSSPQFDVAERGFSFRLDGPLDMRMSKSGLSAFDIVNEWSESDLADIIFHYGDERAARKIARKIVNDRKTSPITTTFELADIVRAVVPKKRFHQSDEATKTFQAIRIAVNEEMQELETFLEGFSAYLNPLGRVGIISFHSTEDRIVKNAFRKLCGDVPNTSRHLPNINESELLFNYVAKSGDSPSEEEKQHNPRARSARLRVIEKK
jgi:16S rRNA (cytosine1402-N4)-methyltransferase